MNETAKVSTLIVDDEPLARAGLHHMLAEIEWIECIGEAANGPAAIEAINTLQPELVFLDIQMPGLFGTEVIARVQHQPFVLFTTAYAQHAVTAFELGALDYLLKPFGEDRLRAALERVRAAVGEPRTSAFNRFSETMSHAPMSRLFIRSGRSIVPLKVTDVTWFEAVGDYIAARLVAGGQEPTRGARPTSASHDNRRSSFVCSFLPTPDVATGKGVPDDGRAAAFRLGYPREESFVFLLGRRYPLRGVVLRLKIRFHRRVHRAVHRKRRARVLRIDAAIFH